MALNFGPAPMNFEALGSLGKTFQDAQAAAQKRGIEQQKQQLLSGLGQGGGDFQKVGLGLIGAGDVQSGVAILGLAQKEKERQAEAEWFKGLSGGGASASPSAPSAPTAALGTPNEIENRFIGGVKQAGLNNPVGLAAVAAYGKAESGFSPRNVNRTWNDPSESGQPGQAGGILSWRADRLQKLQSFAAQRGEQGNGSPETQATFLAQEDPTLIPRLNAAKTPQEANQIMANAWRFAGYNREGGENARRLALTQQYAGRFGAGGEQPSATVPLGSAPQPVQVAENEADVQRLEAQMPGYGGNAQAQVARSVAPIPGDDPARLRAEAQYYAQSNPEASRQLLARADAAERGTAPVQVAQAPAQAGSPVADVPASGARPAQGFAIPGATPQQTQSIAADPKVQEARNRYLRAPERFRAAAKADLDLAIEDAKAAIVAARDPENIREFMIARQRGFTQARTPQEYAREKERPRAPMSVGPDTRLVNPDTGAVVFDGTQGPSKTARENAQREDEANRRGLTGPERDAYIFNGKLPSQSEKAPTEGQANAALYANRMREAEAVFAQPGVLEAGMSRLQQGVSKVPGVGNSIVSSEFQQVDQAQRNFINAVLRRESGAVISDPEFDNARKQYFPQPGDKPEVLAQKARNRQTAIQGIENAAGPAKRQQPEQQQATQKPAPVIREGARAQGPNGQIIVLRNGKWVSE